MSKPSCNHLRGTDCFNKFSPFAVQFVVTFLLTIPSGLWSASKLSNSCLRVDGFGLPHLQVVVQVLAGTLVADARLAPPAADAPKSEVSMAQTVSRQSLSQ